MFLRVLAVAGSALLVRWLTHSIGPLGAALTWIAISVVVCAAVGFRLSRPPVGEVGPINRIAGPILFWGASLARGRLVNMVLWSIGGWTAVGVIAALAAGGATTAPAGPVPDSAPGTLTWALLVASWLVLAFVLYRLAITLTWRPAPPKSWRTVLVVAALLVVSIVLASIGRHGLALAIAGGPPLVVGGGYLLMVLVMLASGEKVRWN